jgi:hypothetical protein
MRGKMLLAALGIPALLAAAALVWWRLPDRELRTAAVPSDQGSPLFEPDDKPLTILVREVDLGTGRPLLAKETIRESRSRYNQMKQAVLFYLEGSRRKGSAEVPSPEGIVLNELFFTPKGEVVVDLSVSGVDRSGIGFYEENLFIRGLIEVFTRNFYEVRRVRILVDGRDEPTLFGHYALGTTE